MRGLLLVDKGCNICEPLIQLYSSPLELQPELDLHPANDEQLPWDVGGLLGVSAFRWSFRGSLEKDT